MRRKNQARRYWSWWLLGALVVLALILGTWGIMRPGSRQEADKPRTTTVKESTKKEKVKEKKKKEKRTDQSRESSEQTTAPATASQDSVNVNGSSSQDTTGSTGSTTTQSGTTNQVTPPKQDDSAYDSALDAAGGTEIGGELNNLVAELNKLASQYAEFQDVDAFNSGLANIQARNNQLLAQAQTNADRNLATKINGTIGRMQADPANAQYIVNHIWH